MTHPPTEPNPRVRLITVEATDEAVYGAIVPGDYTGSDLDGYGIKATPAAWALLESAVITDHADLTPTSDDPGPFAELRMFVARQQAAIRDRWRIKVPGGPS